MPRTSLSDDAKAVMDQLREAYIAQGYPPYREWWFNIPQKLGDELTGHGLIEVMDLEQWALTNAGHQWVMT